jgi:Flp pilus assembly protein TadD
MDVKIERTGRLRAVVATCFLLSILIPSNAIGVAVQGQVCDVGADYSLGLEDYPEAIRLHLRVVRDHPENALAHYHLGFALGMVGDRAAELREYRQAEALGLQTWDLSVNLGLAQLQVGDLESATRSLRHAVALRGDDAESHFNLALVYHGRGMLADAEREVLASLRLNRGQLDARNPLGVIYAEQGDTARASSVWHGIEEEAPDFAPARINLGIVGGLPPAAIGQTAAASPTRRPPLMPSEIAADRSDQYRQVGFSVFNSTQQSSD